MPLTVGLFALIGMAISAEDRQRTEQDTVSVGSPSGGPSDEQIPAAGAGAADPPPDGGISNDTTTSTSAPSDGAAGAEQAAGDDSGGSGTEPVNMEVSGPAGRLGVQLGGANPIARPIGADDLTGAPSELVEGPQGPTAQAAGDGTAAAPGSTPDGSTPDGTAQGGDGAAPTVGLKLGADGQLQPVSQDQIAPGDLVVAPAGGGLDVLRPDGSRVQIRPGPSSDGSGLVASEVTADGVTGLQPSDEGQIDVGDGVTVTLPTPDPIDLSNESDGGLTGPGWARLAALAAAVVLLLAGLWLWLRRRRRARATTPDGAGGEAVAPPLPGQPDRGPPGLTGRRSRPGPGHPPGLLGRRAGHGPPPGPPQHRDPVRVVPPGVRHPARPGRGLVRPVRLLRQHPVLPHPALRRRP